MIKRRTATSQPEVTQTQWVSHSDPMTPISPAELCREREGDEREREEERERKRACRERERVEKMERGR